jgi:hypothetical protein
MDQNSPEKPLTVSANTKPDRTERVFFFEKPDGTIIHVDEKSAWALWKRPQQTIWGPIRYKYVGTTDGSNYHRALLESNAIFKEQGLEAAQVFLREALEKEQELAKQDRTLPRNFDETDNRGVPNVISRL